MKHLKKFNEGWDYNPSVVADNDLAQDIANDILPRLQKMRSEGKFVTTEVFDEYMKERGSSFELSDSVMNILVDMGFDFDIIKSEE